MRQSQQKSRSRGRGGRKQQNPVSRNFESNGPDVKIRGNAAHIAEKYTTLARDALSSGDTVMAENYLQHAEHYNRIIASAQAAQQVNHEMRHDRHNNQSMSGEGEDGFIDDDQPDMMEDMPGGFGQARFGQPVYGNNDDDGDEVDAAPSRDENRFRRNDGRPNGNGNGNGRPRRIRRNEGRPNEVRANEARPNEVRVNEGRPNEVRPNEVRGNEDRSNEARAVESKGAEVRANGNHDDQPMPVPHGVSGEKRERAHRPSPKREAVVSEAGDDTAKSSRSEKAPRRRRVSEAVPVISDDAAMLPQSITGGNR